MPAWQDYSNNPSPALDDTLLEDDVSNTSASPDGTVESITIGEELGLVGYVAPSGVTAGTSDPVNVNAMISAVAALGGGTVKGIPSGPWYLDTPFVLKSNVTLDMTGCVITEVAGSNCNMITNASAVATPTSGTGSMTSGGNTLTTSLGASAVVGQSVYVAGAANGGSSPLCGIVGAQTGTTITVTDFYGNPLNAGHTVSGAAVSLYSRDSKIEVKGGTWNRGANGFTGGGFVPQATGNNFRRVDGLHVHDLMTSCTGKGYQTLYGDCTNFHFHDITVKAPTDFTTVPNTDGIHGWGPLAFGTVENIFGTNGDDFVILDGLDPGLTIDVCGNISDVTVRNLYPGQGASPNGGGACIIITQGTFTIQRVRVDGIHGSSRTDAVGVGSTGTGCLVDDLLITNVDNTTTSTSIGLASTGGGNITIRDVAWAGNAATGAGNSVIFVDPAANIGGLTVDGATMEVSSNPSIILNIQGAVGTAIVKNVNQAAALAQGDLVHIESGATVGVLGIDGMHLNLATGGSGQVVFVNGALGRMHVSDLYLKGTGTTFLATASGTAEFQCLMANVTLDSCNSLAVLSSPVDFVIHGLNIGSLDGSLGIWLGNAATTVSVRGSGLVNPNSYPLFGNLGTPTTPPRVVMAEALADASSLSRAHAGDTVFNTNSGLTCGTGVLLSNGSGSSGSWKNLFSGSTY